MLLFLTVAFIAAVSSEPPSNRPYRPDYTDYQDNSHKDINDELTPPLATYEHEGFQSDRGKSAGGFEENKESFPEHLRGTLTDPSRIDEDVADNPRNRGGWQDEVPGTAGKDYPDLERIPETSFSCADKVAGGYYADVETGCQVFHVCNTGGVKSSFLCPPGSIFNQKYFVCDWWYDFECDSAPELYSLNRQLNRKVPESGEQSGEKNPSDRYQNIGNSLTDNGDLSLAGTGHSNYQENSGNHFHGGPANSESDRGKSFARDFQVNEDKIHSDGDTYRGRITVSYWPPRNERNEESREENNQGKINPQHEQSNTQRSEEMKFSSPTNKQDNVPRGFSLSRYSENSNRVSKKLSDTETRYLSPDYDSEEENVSGKPADASRDGNFGEKFHAKPTTSYLEPPSEQQGDYKNVIKNDYQVIPLNRDEEDQKNQDASRDEKVEFSSGKSTGQSVLSRRDFPESKAEEEEDGVYFGLFPRNGDSRDFNRGSNNAYRTAEKDLIFERPPLPPLPAFPVAYIDFAKKQTRVRLRGGRGYPSSNKNLPGSEVVAGTTTNASPTISQPEASKPLGTSAAEERKAPPYNPEAGPETQGEKYSTTTQRIFPATDQQVPHARNYSSRPADGVTFHDKHDPANHSAGKFIPGERDSQGQRDFRHYSSEEDSYSVKGNRQTDNDRGNSSHFTPFDSFNEGGEEQYLPGL